MFFRTSKTTEYRRDFGFGFLKNYGVCIMKKTLVVTLMRCQPKTTKTLHKTIKKVADDIENFSFNTSVSQFMICVNELSTQNATRERFLSLWR
jgi:leucyl-tRNA synthetase